MIYKNRHILLWLLTVIGMTIVGLNSWFHIKSIATQINSHLLLDAIQMNSYVVSRIEAHQELVNISKDLPFYIKNLMWLVDEFQSQPLLYGVALWYKDKLVLNTFPKGKIPFKPSDLSQNKTLKGNLFVVKSELFLYPKGKHILIVATNASFHLGLLRKSKWHEFILWSISSLGFVLLAITFSFFLKKEEEIEKKLKDTEKMAAMGKITSLIAHEIKNPLNSLSMGIQFLHHIDINEGKRNILKRMEKDISKLNNLITDISQVIRGIKLNIEPIRSKDFIKDIENNFSFYIRNDSIRLVLEAKDDFKFFGDREWLVRAVSNLIKNGLEAIENTGTVHFKLYRKGDHIVFEVMDTGKGLEKKEVREITRPFYTTKRFGFGIGLYLVEIVAKAHKGVLKIKPSISQGTVISLIIKDQRDGL